MAPAKTGAIQGQFKKGQSGNPAGRPKGARNKATIAVEALLGGEASKLARKAIERAMEGDIAALRLCLERICPPKKDRSIHFELPEFTGADDLPDVAASIIRAASRGELSLSEAESMLRMLDSYRRSIDSAEIERRLLALEAVYVESR